MLPQKRGVTLYLPGGLTHLERCPGVGNFTGCRVVNINKETPCPVLSKVDNLTGSRYESKGNSPALTLVENITGLLVLQTTSQFILHLSPLLHEGYAVSILRVG